MKFKIKVEFEIETSEYNLVEETKAAAAELVQAML